MPKSLTPPDMNAARASRKKCGSSVSGRDLPDGFTAKSDFATEASLLPDFQCPIPIGDGSSLPVSTMIFTFQYNPQLCEVQIKCSSTTCAASELESVKIRRRNIKERGAFRRPLDPPREPNVGFEIMDGVAVGDFLRVRLDIRKKKPSCWVRACRCAICG